MLPFLVAIPLFLIPMLWLSRRYCDDGGCIPPDATVDSSLGTFYAKWLAVPGKLFNNISWLWYLPAMFVDFLLTYPILRWTKRRAAGLPFGRGDVETVVL